MNILIVGCQRVGAHLARELDLAGHDISVLEEVKENFELLNTFNDYSFSGMEFTGIPIDIDVLKNAGIENVDAVASVTPDDSTNLMVSQIASKLFSVKKVICRVSNPELVSVYRENFGIHVVSPTALTTKAVTDSLLDNEAHYSFNLGNNTAGIILEAIKPEHIDMPAANVKVPRDHMLFGILRANGNLDLANSPSLVLRSGDQLIWAKVLV